MVVFLSCSCQALFIHTLSLCLSFLLIFQNPGEKQEEREDLLKLFTDRSLSCTCCRPIAWANGKMLALCRCTHTRRHTHTHTQTHTNTRRHTHTHTHTHTNRETAKHTQTQTHTHMPKLNTLKTMEMTVDFRRSPPALPPLIIHNSTVLAVESFRFLGSTISRNLKWETNINTIIKKAQQRMYFLRHLRKYNLPQELLILFYTAVIESILCTSITVWFGSATKLDKNRLQRSVRSAEKIIGANLPTIQDLYTSRV